MTTSRALINHLFIVDASSASSSLTSSIRAQVNDSLDSIRESNTKRNSLDHRITLFLFRNNHLKCVLSDVSIKEVGSFMLETKGETQTGQTLDALGTCIATWRAMNNRGSNNGKYSVTIFSTGRDHGSRKYSTCTLKTIIESLTENGWHFTMVSSNALLPRVSAQLGIKNYYVCRNSQMTRDRNFLITQLKRQWFTRQMEINVPVRRIDHAA